MAALYVMDLYRPTGRLLCACALLVGADLAETSKRPCEGERRGISQCPQGRGCGTNAGLGESQSGEAQRDGAAVQGCQPRQDHRAETGLAQGQPREAPRSQQALEDQSPTQTMRLRRDPGPAGRYLRDLRNVRKRSQGQRSAGNRSFSRDRCGARSALSSLQRDARPGQGQHTDLDTSGCLPGGRR